MTSPLILSLVDALTTVSTYWVAHDSVSCLTGASSPSRDACALGSGRPLGVVAHERHTGCYLCPLSRERSKIHKSLLESKATTSEASGEYAGSQSPPGPDEGRLFAFTVGAEEPLPAIQTS